MRGWATVTQPPFPHYDKPAGPIEAHAGKLAQIGERYAAQSLRIRRNHCDAVSVTSGILFQPISRAADPPAARAAALGQQALVHSGATKLWAAAIETFNRGVDKLNQEWASAQASGFGITEPVPHGNAQVVNAEFDRYSHQVAAARRAEVGDLQRRYEHLKERLHDTALGVHNLYRADPGDYQPIIAAMVGAGLLPNSLTTPPPGGGPAPLPASMAAANPCERGNDFEANILKDLGVDKNTTIYDVIENADGTYQVVTRKPFAPRGGLGDLANYMFKRGTIPDGVTDTNIIEIKDLTRLLRPTPQIRQQIELAVQTGRKYTLILGPDSPGLSPALKQLLEKTKALDYEVKQAASRGDSGTGTSPTWGSDGRPDVGGHNDDDPGVQPPFCGPDDNDPPPPAEPKPVPVPVPEPQPVPQPDHHGGLLSDLLADGVVVVGVGSKIVAVAGAPESGGLSLGLLAVP